MYKIGQSVEPRALSVVGDKLDQSVWHLLFVQPQKELAMVARLNAILGVSAFCPTHTKARHIRGKKIETIRPEVSRMIYAKFSRRPMWHILAERGYRPLVQNGWPVALPPDIIRQIRGLPTEAEKLEAEKQRLQREIYELKAGERGIITGGVFSGNVVEVSEVRSDNRLWFLVDNPTVRGESKIGGIERIGEK